MNRDPLQSVPTPLNQVSNFIAFPKFEACIEGEGSSHLREKSRGGRGVFKECEIGESVEGEITC